MKLLRRRPRALVFCNASQRPWTNNLLPAVEAFGRVTQMQLVEPYLHPGFTTTGGAAPTPVPESAVREGARADLDLVVCIGGGLVVPPELQPLLAGAPMIGIALSDPLGLAASLAMASSFDVFCTQDPDSVPAYEAAGIAVRRLDLAVDVDLYRPADVPPTCDVVFLGKWTPYRAAVVEAVASVADVRLHGYAAETRWPVENLGQLDDPAALAAALRRARLALECVVMDDAPPPYDGRPRMTPRPQLAAACGRPSLVEDFPRLREYLEPGREVFTYTGPDDVATAAAAALADPAELDRRGAAARARVAATQTWDLRAAELLRTLPR